MIGVMPGRESVGSESFEKIRVVLLAVDPRLIHAYWVMSPDSLAEINRMLAKDYERAQVALRFHDMAYTAFHGSNEHGFFDVPIDLRAKNWYLHLPSPEKSYCADLGLRTEDGRFLSLARSNLAETPRASPSGRKEVSYTLIQGIYERVEQAALARSSIVGRQIIQDGNTGSLEVSAEVKPRIEPTELAEKAFVSGISSMLIHTPTGKTK